MLFLRAEVLPFRSVIAQEHACLKLKTKGRAYTHNSFKGRQLHPIPRGRQRPQALSPCSTGPQGASQVSAGASAGNATLGLPLSRYKHPCPGFPLHHHTPFPFPPECGHVMGEGEGTSAPQYHADVTDKLRGQSSPHSLCETGSSMITKGFAVSSSHSAVGTLGWQRQSTIPAREEINSQTLWSCMLQPHTSSTDAQP